MLRLLPHFAIVALAAVAVHAASVRHAALPRRVVARLSAPPLATVPPRSLDLITLGHTDVYDDAWVIWATQTLSDKEVDGRLEDMHALSASLVQQLPPSEMIYYYACFTYIYTFQHPEECERLTLAGLRRFPKSWRLPVLQAWLATTKTNEPAKASSYYLLAASRPNAPAYMRKLAARLARREAVASDEMNETLGLLMSLDGDEKFKQMVQDLKTKTGGP